MTSKQNIIYVNETIPSKVQRDSILNISAKSVNTGTHGFHKYPAKFIPQIPIWAISKHLAGDKNKTILDPFCGSGTTLVEGMLSGHNVFGIDVDPFSVLISKVKATGIDIDLLNLIVPWLVLRVKETIKGTFIPECENIDHWFTKDAIKKLSGIRSILDIIPDTFGQDSNVRNILDLLLVCFSSIIRRVSNADNESQKTYVSHTNVKTPEEVNALFLRQLDYYYSRIVEFTEKIGPATKSRVLCGSSVSMLNHMLCEQHVDLAITSPPYIKAIDYIYNQMAELFWVGDLFDIQTQPKQNEKKVEYVGNKQIKIAEYRNYNPIKILTGINILDLSLQKVFSTDIKNGHKHSYITYKYFTDMDKHFRQMATVMKRDSVYVMVVGNSSVSNVRINTVDIIGQLAEINNFTLLNKWCYKIKNRYMRFDRKGRGGIIEHDWVLEFVKR